MTFPLSHRQRAWKGVDITIAGGEKSSIHFDIELTSAETKKKKAKA